MGRHSGLGPLEQSVLWAIVGLGDQAYGVPIRRKVIEHGGREIAVGAIYTTLSRLEEKGLISSKMGEATAERGGRRKKYYQVTATGRAALNEVRKRHEEMWQSLPVAEGAV